MKKKRNLFFVLRAPSGAYKILFEAAKAHYENFANKKLTFKINKNNNIDFIAIIYLIKIIIETSFFSKKKN